MSGQSKQINARVMATLLGRTAMVGVGQWRIKMKILDGRQVWGKVHLLVAPVDGTGEAWIDWDRAEIID